MNKFLYIFIAFALFRFTDCFAVTEYHSQEILSINKYERTAEGKTAFINKNNTGCSVPSSKFSSDNSKKRKSKGIYSFRFYSSNEKPLTVYFVDEKITYSSQTSYISRLFFSNEKRGPPSLSVS